MCVISDGGDLIPSVLFHKLNPI